MFTWKPRKPWEPFQKQPPQVVMFNGKMCLQRGPLLCDTHRDQVERCHEFCSHHIGYIMEPWPAQAGPTITLECIDEVSHETTQP